MPGWANSGNDVVEGHGMGKQTNHLIDPICGSEVMRSKSSVVSGSCESNVDGRDIAMKYYGNIQNHWETASHSSSMTHPLVGNSFNPRLGTLLTVHPKELPIEAPNPGPNPVLRVAPVPRHRKTCRSSGASVAGPAAKALATSQLSCVAGGGCSGGTGSTWSCATAWGEGGWVFKGWW